MSPAFPLPSFRASARAATLCLCLLPLLAATSCDSPASDSAADVSPGVRFERGAGADAGFQTIAVDLRAAAVRPAVVAENVSRTGNNFVGNAFTVRDWCQKTGALAGMNGGFFGATYDDAGSRKQIVQLAAADGKVLAPGSDTASSRTPGERYLRSAVGFRADGTPEIVWATGTTKGGLRAYGSPVNPDRRAAWSGVESAVACGPRLYAGGVLRISDKTERLVSPQKLTRAFVAYDADDSGKPLHFVMGRADAADYRGVADFAARFFAAHYKTQPAEAMCLDGGPSSQLVYRRGGELVDAAPTGVRVPTAIVLLPYPRGSGAR